MFKVASIGLGIFHFSHKGFNTIGRFAKGLSTKNFNPKLVICTLAVTCLAVILMRNRKFRTACSKSFKAIKTKTTHLFHRAQQQLQSQLLQKHNQPLAVGNVDEQGHRPRIYITGEKTHNFVINALRKYTNQEIISIDLKDLAVKAKDFDLDKDLLLVVIEKVPGNCPIRGFAEWDGPLNQYKSTIFSFKKCAALVVVNPSEAKTIEQVQEQANYQLPNEMKKNVIYPHQYWTTSNNQWAITKKVQELFQ
jgi:hypothetical protein